MSPSLLPTSGRVLVVSNENINENMSDPCSICWTLPFNKVHCCLPLTHVWDSHEFSLNCNGLSKDNGDVFCIRTKLCFKVATVQQVHNRVLKETPGLILFGHRHEKRHFHG
nr:uncharacterized protein LOC106731726 isoform X2 [Pelodiscus sinensis]|eukprot:XP_014427203.1 uncharacterized protein LOC106731726 isoform X2 [Pelodiscus sinensis]